MKRLTIILICFFSLFNLKASPQEPDFLIIGKDTFELYFLPLYELNPKQLDIFQHNLISRKKHTTSSLYLGRECQAVWRLEDNKLYLVGLKDNPNSAKILKATFGDNYQKGKVLATWFSSRLAIPKDKWLRWDEKFSRTYLKEEIFDFKNGELKSRKLVDNYVHVENGISRQNQYKFEEFITQKMRQMVRPTGFDQFWVTIDENGKVSDVKFDSMKKSSDSLKDQFKDMQFDIIKWNGEPYKETIFMEIY